MKRQTAGSAINSIFRDERSDEHRSEFSISISSGPRDFHCRIVHCVSDLPILCPGFGWMPCRLAFLVVPLSSRRLRPEPAKAFAQSRPASHDFRGLGRVDTVCSCPFSPALTLECRLNSHQHLISAEVMSCVHAGPGKLGPASPAQRHGVTASVDTRFRRPDGASSRKREPLRAPGPRRVELDWTSGAERGQQSHDGRDLRNADEFG